MKGLILAAGKGTRMENALSESSKCLAKVCGITLLEHNLLRLLKIGVDSVVIVIGETGGDIKARLGSSYRDIPVEYVVQPTPKGIADAVSCAATLLEGGEFALCLGDELLVNEKPGEMVDFFRSTGAFCVCGVTVEPEEAIRKNYSVAYTDGSLIKTLTEKPEKPVNSYKGTGFCLFRPEMLGYLPSTPLDAVRKQYELCGWIQTAVDDGRQARLFPVADEEINVNTPENYRYAKRRFAGRGAENEDYNRCCSDL